LKNARAWAVFLICVSGLASGCAKHRSALQIAEYVNQGILTVAELEQKSLERYASVVGSNYTSDQAVYDALKEFVVPIYGRYLDELRKIQPETEELKQLHKIYIQGAESMYSGFKMKLAGIEKKDEFIIRAANEKIQEGKNKTDVWRENLTALYRKYGRQ